MNTLLIVLRFFPTAIFVLSICAALVAACLFFFGGQDIEALAKQSMVYWSAGALITYSVTYL